MTKRFGLFLTLALALPLGAESLIPKVDVSLDLGTERRNWTRAKWKVVELEKPVSLADASGLVLAVTTEAPRGDAGVTLGLRETDGTWYTHPWASDLSVESNRSEIKFHHFSTPAYHSPPKGGFKDENDRLDTDSIDAIALGVVNPLGVGEVKFRVESVEPLREKKSPLPPVEVEITGRLLSINGTDTLPAGVFGGFNLKSKDGVKRTERYRLAMDRRIDFSGYMSSPKYGTAETPILITAVGDRTQPSKRLVKDDWESRYREAGRALGEQAKADQRKVYVEFWNEPYLNWANDTRVNFDPAFYNLSEAEEGGAVRLRLDGSEMPHLRWTKDMEKPGWNWVRAGRQEWRRGRTDNGKLSISEHARPYKTPHHLWRRKVNERNPPDDVADGETYTAKGKTYTAFTPWHIYDETQFTYWSGKGMLKPYIDPLKVYADAMKEAGGAFVEVIAGWGNRPSEDHWAAFEMLYKPMIDATVEVIDAYNDHDYGGDPRLMPANYEVVTGYAQAEHGKWLYAYNTETASNADPQAVGEVSVSGDAFKFKWVSRKIAAVLNFSADKCRGLAHFGVGGGFWSDGGEGVAMDLMRNLRGRLVETVDTASDLYVISAIDGTDPMAPRPDDLPNRQELVTLLLNDSPEERKVSLRIRPPRGTAFDDGALSKGEVDWATGTPRVLTKTFDVSPRLLETEISLEPGMPYVLTLGLRGRVAPDAPAAVERTQYFAHAFLHQVTPDAPLETSISIDSPAEADRATLRIVADHIRPGEAEVVLNGVAIPLPEVVAPENAALIKDIAVPEDVDLGSVNQLEFRMRDVDQAGFQLGAVSLIVDTVKPK